MTRRTLELIAFFVALLLAAMALHAWLAAHDEQQRLAATLAAQRQLLDAADARERDRNTALNDTLAAIAKLKATALTPEQIVRELPSYLQLPQAITLDTSHAASTSPDSPRQKGSMQSSATGHPPAQAFPSTSTTLSALTTSTVSSPSEPPSAPTTVTAAVPTDDLPAAPAAKIPAADLQPLFDFVQDCRACQAKLAVAQQNSTDDAAKIAALTRERDAAITASKGGSFLRRLRRNALWFGIGAGVGYALAKR